LHGSAAREGAAVRAVPQVQEKFANAKLSPEEAAERLLKEAEREVVRKEMADKELERGVKGSGVDQNSLASTVQARPCCPFPPANSAPVMVYMSWCREPSLMRRMQGCDALHQPSCSCVSAVACSIAGRTCKAVYTSLRVWQLGKQALC
jgi:hypothetical protein